MITISYTVAILIALAVLTILMYFVTAFLVASYSEVLAQIAACTCVISGCIFMVICVMKLGA